MHLFNFKSPEVCLSVVLHHKTGREGNDTEVGGKNLSPCFQQLLQQKSVNVQTNQKDVILKVEGIKINIL